MDRFKQKGRALEVKTPLEDDVLLLEGFSGLEAISRPFRFTLELLSEDPAIDPASLLRESVTVLVNLPDGTSRPLHGKIARFTQVGTAAVLHGYQAEMVPWLWFLSLSRDCRIFQNRSVLEIVEEIFADYPEADFSVECLNAYPPREYCVQYRESDLDFVSRILAEEGIFYFFEHSESSHRLILADDPSSIPPCEQKEVRVGTRPRGEDWEDTIQILERGMAVHPTSVSLTDYDHLQPSLNLLSSASAGGYEEVYDYPGEFSDTSQGERYAGLRLEALTSSRETIQGQSEVRAFRSGHRFSLVDYAVEAANQAYLLVSVEHRAKESSYGASGEGEVPQYRNHFRCIPASLPYRPEPPGEPPFVRGSQTAVVVGPSGEEIYTDEHGRVKVHFHWDREGKKDENSSCWVRVSQPWAGKSWGAVAIPRIGQEVIVDFLEGNPNRPIITGRVYNGAQVPPYDLPANKTQTGIKSRSTKGGSGSTFNEIRMEDKKGEELLYLHAEKDRRAVVENNNTESVGNDESTTVGHDQLVDVEHVRTVKVGKDHSESVGEKQEITIGADRSLAVGGGLEESVGEDMKLSVSGDLTEEMGGDRSISIGSDWTVKAGSKGKLLIGKDFVLLAKKIAIEASDEISLKVGSASITLKKSGDVEVKGMNVKVDGKGKVDVKASSKVTLKGAQVVGN